MSQSLLFNAAALTMLFTATLHASVMPAFFPQYLSPTAQSLALLFEHPLGVGWCFLHKQQMGKSSFIREERATVYYLNIAFLLAGA